MRLSLCIVGCGRYARSVLEEIHDMTEELQLFFASRDSAKAKEYCDTFGGAGHFGSYEEAVSDPRVQAAYFFTPHHLHLENARLAARHSKHILMEKPIAPTLDESRAMIRAAEQAKVTLMVAENYRFMPTVQKCGELIRQGRVGDLRLVEIHHESYEQHTGWRTKNEYRGGGSFIDGGIHAVDMMLSFGGIPDRVYASTLPRLSDDVEGEDGFRLNEVSSMREISRDPTDLAAQTIGANHQYPDGFVLFTGTMFAPTKDRDAPGGGFTHHMGDRVTIASPKLGTLWNRVGRTDRVPPWTFGLAALMRNLAARGLI